jgi:hypothetical protein
MVKGPDSQVFADDFQGNHMKYGWYPAPARVGILHKKNLGGSDCRKAGNGELPEDTMP